MHPLPAYIAWYSFYPEIPNKYSTLATASSLSTLYFGYAIPMQEGRIAQSLGFIYTYMCLLAH